MATKTRCTCDICGRTDVPTRADKVWGRVRAQHRKDRSDKNSAHCSGVATPVDLPSVGEPGQHVTWSDGMTTRRGFVTGPFSWWTDAGKIGVRGSDGALYGLAPDRLTVVHSDAG